MLLITNCCLYTWRNIPKGQQNRLIFEGDRAICLQTKLRTNMALALSKINRFCCPYGMLCLVFRQQFDINNIFFYDHFEISKLSFSVISRQNILIFLNYRSRVNRRPGSSIFEGTFWGVFYWNF